MITEELFVKVIESMRIQNHEDRKNGELIAEAFGSDMAILYDNSKLIVSIIDLLSLYFDREEIEHYCFELNFGKPNSENAFYSPQELYKKLTS